MKNSLFVCIALLLYSLANSQSNQQCATQMTPESMAYFNQLSSEISHYEMEYYQLINANRSSVAISHVPIKVHIVRPSNGVGGITLPDFNTSLEGLNSYYSEAYLEFFLCEEINYIDSDTFYDLNYNQEALLTTNNVDNVINIYFVNTITVNTTDYCAYSYFPGGPEIVVMSNWCTTNGTVLSHEMGHFFGLPHTHGDGTTNELVNGSNCNLAGDFFCDTPADPFLNDTKVNEDCEYIATEFDTNGDLYMPSTRNIMSYTRPSCRSEFTPQQYARLYATYQASRLVMACPNFNINIDANYAPSCNNTLNVNFTDNSVGAISWEWDVDGDNIIDYTTQNPSHTYTSSGAFDVTLTISNGTQSITKVHEELIDFTRVDISTSQINLLITLDSSPQETSWELKDDSGTVLYSSPTYVSGLDNFQTFSYDFDVSSDQCYVFDIYDSENDGICCGYEGVIAYELTTLENSSIRASDGVFGSNETTFIANDVLGVDDYFVTNQISTYPNPTNDVLNIKLSNTNNLPDSYTIYNMLGQVIIAKTITQIEDLSIQVKSFSEGVYYVKVSKGTNSSTIPFIKN